MRLLVLIAWGLVACGEVPEPDDVTLSDIDGDGFSSAEGDCDDNDPEIYPGADDIVGDNIDRNCDQSDGVDADGDRDPSLASGGGDCNDEDGTINSEAEEIGWDGIDQDCDNADQYDFDDVCGGRFFTCGVSSVGEIHCWGTALQNDVVANRPQEGQFVQIDCGEEFACALEYDGSVECWGDDADGVVTNVTKSPALNVYAGFDHACVIRRSDGRAECWGKSTAYAGVAGVSSAVRDMALGSNYSCFTRNQGGAVGCVGESPPADQEQYPIFNNEEWIKISGGNRFVFGINRKQQLDWFAIDDPTNGETNPADDVGPYSWLDMFNDWGCAIKEATELTCWGSDFNPVATTPFLYNQPTADVSLFRVGVGFRHACAIRNEDGELVCWGDENSFDAITVPDFAGYAANP